MNGASVAPPAGPAGRLIASDIMLVTCPNCAAAYRLDETTLGAGRRLRCSRCRTQWFAKRAQPSARAPEPAPDPEPEFAPASEPTPIFGIEDSVPIDAIETNDILDAIGAAPQTQIDEPQKAARPRRARLRALFARRPKKGEPAPLPAAAGKPPLRTRLPRARGNAVFAAIGFVTLGAMVQERARLVAAAPSLASLYAAIGLEVNVRGLAIRDLKSREEIEEGVPLLLVSGQVANVAGANVEVPRLRLAVNSKDNRELYAWTAVANRVTLAPGEVATFRARLASPPAEGSAIAVRFVRRQDLTAQAGH